MRKKAAALVYALFILLTPLDGRAENPNALRLTDGGVLLSGNCALDIGTLTLTETEPEALPVSIPAQAAQDLIDGTIAGLALFAPDAQTVSGLSYSQNYARFYGSAGGADTKPKLTVNVREV